MILAVLVVGAGVWFTVHQIQINQDRARFMQAKSDLHVIAEHIVGTVGQPDEWQAADFMRIHERRIWERLSFL